MFSVLVADDEKKIRETIKDYLTAKGLIIQTAFDGMDALEKFEQGNFDLVILDVMMPRLSGFETCRKIRKISKAPVVFLTAKGQEQDFLSGYNCGGDDYIVKPFPLSVLYEKCISIIKRYKGIDRDNVLNLCGISLNLSSYKLMVDGKDVAIPHKDFKILYYLMENKNIVLSRDLILTYVWGYDFDGDDRVVDTHIKRIRKLLGEKSGCIKTIVNAGYSFQEV